MFLRTLARLLEKLIARSCVFLILALRPLLGPAACRYTVGCTSYAIDQLQHKPLHEALWSILKRVISCSPFGGWFEPHSHR